MVCPVCGTPLVEGTTLCPQCGATINNNPMPMNPMSMNNPVDNHQNITVPKDFILAGGVDSNGGGTEELPDGLASLLGIKEEEAPVPKKKTRKKRMIRSIILLIMGLIFLAIVLIFIIGLIPEKETFDLICTRVEKKDGVISETESKYSNQGGFFNSENKTIMSKEDKSSFTLEDKAKIEEQVGSLGFNQRVELDKGKIIITYSNSHYNVNSVNQLRQESENSGAKCK